VTQEPSDHDPQRLFRSSGRSVRRVGVGFGFRTGTRPEQRRHRRDVVPGYRRRDAPSGVGKLSGGAGARIPADARFGPFMAGLGATRALTGDVDGTLVDASLAMPVRASERLTVIPSISATWADGAYNRAYFGIDARQAAASGLAAYRPGGGLKDVSAALTASYRLNDKVTLGATGVVSSLRGDAKNSPIVVDATQPAAFVSVAYRF